MSMITMRDVAQRAGVSSTTVSFVLSGRHPVGGPISQETRDRVLTVAKQMGYRRNGLMRAVARGHSHTFGFLADRLSQEFTARILAGALEEARAAGYGLQVLQLNSSQVNKESIETCLEMRLVGLVAIDVDREALDYLHQEMEPHGTPIAFLDSGFRKDWGIHVTSDDAQGGRLAIRHLVELGHRRIAFIGGQPGTGMAACREQAYRDTMKELGLEVPPAYVKQGTWMYESGDQCARELLSLDPRPTAIFCANDEMALGTQRAARYLGLRLPTDLSVVGFANLQVARMADPPLTTVNQPMNEMGAMAIHLLLERLKNGEQTNERKDEIAEVLMPTHLEVRESTAAPIN